MTLEQLGFKKTAQGEYVHEDSGQILKLYTYGHHVRDMQILTTSKDGSPIPLSNDIVLALYEKVMVCPKKEAYEALFIKDHIPKSVSENRVYTPVSQGIWECEHQNTRLEYRLVSYEDRSWVVLATTLDGKKPQPYDTIDMTNLLLELLHIQEDPDHEEKYYQHFK